jgi:hypothetical protein
MFRSGIRFAAASALVLSAGGCSDQAKLPHLPQLAGPGEVQRAAGSVTDVYARIARGARVCWFGPDGALKSTHIFHADVEPPSRGETAEIAVHEIDRTQPSPWGRRVFRVVLVPVDNQTAISVENLAMPDAVAATMRADVFGWVAGKSDCSTRQNAVEAQPVQPVTAAQGKPPRPRAEGAKRVP